METMDGKACGEAWEERSFRLHSPIRRSRRSRHYLNRLARRNLGRSGRSRKLRYRRRDKTYQPDSIIGRRPEPRARLRRHPFDLYGGTVGENFRDALHHFRGVVAHGDHGVGAVLRGVLQ